MAGIFTPVHETTDRVINERRLKTLSTLAQVRADQLTSAKNACHALALALFQNPIDLPFTAIYLFEDESGQAERCTVSTEAGEALAPQLVEAPAAWPPVETILSGKMACNKTVVTRYRISLEQQPYASTTINLRLAAVRRLAYEAADCGLLSADLAAGIRRVKGAKRLGMPVGNWLSAEQGKRLLRATDVGSLRGKRDYATLAILLGCGLRRAELTALRVEEIQQREEHWVIADLIGKGGHIRTIPVPDWVKAAIDSWMTASGIANGTCFDQSTKLAESGVSASAPRSSGALLRRKRRSVRFQLWRPMTFAGPVPVSVIKQVVNRSKSSSY